MSTADIVILSLIALPTIVGVFYGFLNILFSLLSWAVSLGLSIKLVPYFSPLLESYVEHPVLRMVLAFVAIFILSLLIMSGISFLIVKLLGKTGLTAADRILGLFFGMGLGGLIVTAIVFLAGFTAFPQDPWWQESRLAKPFERISTQASRHLPESVTKYHSYEQAKENG
ncbi:MAG TPA: CvpA family protein [Thiotrichaceae bacterium]|jgi:membrane protein required for colicin V production|nr:CvpA family protein [Thiotrichaceae bacterium]HIM08886.1 CvpA family protein [Gammaproteobacteria bacterium]